MRRAVPQQPAVQQCPDHDRPACPACLVRRRGVRHCCRLGHHEEDYVPRSRPEGICPPHSMARCEEGGPLLLWHGPSWRGEEEAGAQGGLQTWGIGGWSGAAVPATPASVWVPRPTCGVTSWACTASGRTAWPTGGGGWAGGGRGSVAHPPPPLPPEVSLSLTPSPADDLCKCGIGFGLVLYGSHGAWGGWGYHRHPE